MLAIVSDLHFCDGTATDRNVDPKAFRLALGEIYAAAADLARVRRSTTRVELVFLGDVFDFLRTERWFEDAAGQPVPVTERPWGYEDAIDGAAPPPSVIARAHGILDAILVENKEALGTLSGTLLAPPAGVEVRRIYFPGNHDRLYLHDASLARRCRDALGAIDETQHEAEGIFPHHLAMPRYGLLARHGHEWDDWNFERYRGAAPSEYQAGDYLATPIGDPITTELAARLPWELGRQLRSSSLDTAEQAAVVRRMQHIEDVRPLLASFHWAFYEATRIEDRFVEVAKRGQLAEALNATVQALASNFRELEFYDVWESRHHDMLHLDSAGKLSAILEALSVVKIQTVGTVAQLFERFVPAKEPHDTCREGAALEDLRGVGTEGLRFVVYGHTHEPLQTPLHAGVTQDLYLNSGTFRNAVFRTDDDKGFAGWDRMTYLTFFSEEEQKVWTAGQIGPGFDAWTGSRSR